MDGRRVLLLLLLVTVVATTTGSAAAIVERAEAASAPGGMETPAGKEKRVICGGLCIGAFGVAMGKLFSGKK